MDHLESVVLPNYLPACRWYGQKDRLSGWLESGRVFQILREPPGHSPGVDFHRWRPADADTCAVDRPEDAGDVTSLPRWLPDSLMAGGSGISCIRLRGGGRIWELLVQQGRWGDSRHHLRGVKGDGIGGHGPASRVLGGEHPTPRSPMAMSGCLNFSGYFPMAPSRRRDSPGFVGTRIPYSPRFGGELRCRLGNEEGSAGLMTSL